MRPASYDREYLEKAIGNSGLKLYQISKLTGLANSHLRLMLRSQTKIVSRENLFGLGISIGLDLKEIKTLCGHYWSPPNEDDLSVFLRLAGRRKIGGRFQLVRGGIDYEVWHLALMGIKGMLISIDNRPYLPMAPHENLPIPPGGADQLLEELFIQCLCEERMRLIEKNLRKGRKQHSVHNIVSLAAFQELLREMKPEQKEKYFKDLKKFLEYPTTAYSFSFYEGTIKFPFLLKYERKKSPTVCFWGSSGKTTTGVIGFFSQRPDLIQALEKEYKNLKLIPGREIIEDIFH